MTPKAPVVKDMTRQVDHYDDLRLQTGEVLALAGLVEVIGRSDLNDAGLDMDELLAGFAAIGRVIGEKMTLIGDHADALYAEARAATK